MKDKVCIAAVALTVLACGCRHGDKAAEESSPAQALERLRAQTRQAILEECTNEVVGIRTIIRASADDSSDAIVKWKGYAEVEYINTAGGVQRTNLQMIFMSAYGEKLYCLADAEFYQKQWLAHMDRVKAGLEK